MSDPNTTMDKVPLPIVKLLGDIHEKVNAISNKADTALVNQREIKREMICMVKTWDAFHGTYGNFLKEELERAQDRAKLRKAMIEKGMMLALVAVVGFVLMATWEKILHAAKAAL